MTGKYLSVLAFLLSLAAQGKPISPPDSARVFVRWTTGKTAVYQGEPLVLRLEMYYNGNVSAPEDYSKLVISDGWVQETKHKPTATRQRIGGQMYGAVTLREYLVIPQKSGSLIVPDYHVTIKVTVPPKPDDFFQTEQTASLPLTASALALKIVSLPQPKPAGFTGAVGQFSFKARADTDSVAPQQPIRLTWLVSGNGSLKFISVPVFPLPAGLEGFDTETTDNWRVTEQGMVGSRAFTQVLVGAQSGDYAIPCLFSYFDPVKKRYVTLTDSVRLTVTGGQNSMPQKARTPTLPSASGLAAWHSQPPDFHRKTDFSDSRTFWILCTLPVLLSMAAFGWLHWQTVRKHSPHRPRREAIQSLQRLEKQLDESNGTQPAAGYFAKQLENVLFTYISHRFSLSAADWHSHRMKRLLRECGLPEPGIMALQKTLRRCNETRFDNAPDSIDCKGEIKIAENSIFEMEKIRLPMRKTGFAQTMRVLPFFFILFSTAPALAQTPAKLYRQAKEKYDLRQFDSAAALLENIVRQGYPNAVVYSNLAASYAQQGKTGLAVLHYENARQLAPGDTLIARNLQRIRQKNGLSAPAEPPLASVISRIDLNAVARLSVACLFAGLVCLLVMAWQSYKTLYADEFDEPDSQAHGKPTQNPARLFRIGLVLSGLGMALLGAVFFIRHYRKTNRAYIVIADAQARYAPSPNAREIARLPEGSSVTEKDAFSGWLKVRLTDGREAWIAEKSVGTIRE